MPDSETNGAAAASPGARDGLPSLVTAAGDVGAETEHGLPRNAQTYVLAIFAIGIAAIPIFGRTLETDQIVGLIVLGLITVAFGWARIPIYGDTTVSIAMVGDFAIAFLFGPAGAALASPFITLATNNGGAWYKRLFNIGSDILVNVAMASVAWWLMGGEFQTSGWLIPIALLAVGVYYVVNVSLVTIAVSLATSAPLLAVWREKFEWLIPHCVVFGLLGLALAVAYDGLGYWGLLAFAAPPLMMRFAIKQYIDRTAVNVEELRHANHELLKANQSVMQMADELRATYDGTLEALVSALDARDRETKGHSLRVAKYAMEIAYRLGMKTGTPEWVDMQRGALLHDVGKIGVSDTILHKPGPLTEEEWVDMRRHPKIGHDMLGEIAFLAGASTIVLAHHERFDGRGYPRGLAGEEIPIGARIFVLADTFDAMTSDRPYRAALSVEASRAEIITCSGTQFDPRCVQAFLLAFDQIVEIRENDREHESEHHAAAAPRLAA